MQSGFTVGILVCRRKGWYTLSVTLLSSFRRPQAVYPRTTTDCRPYRSFLSGCRFGRSGSSGFVGGFHRLRLSNRGLGPRGVAVGIGVDIGISAVPNESGFLFEVV